MNPHHRLAASSLALALAAFAPAFAQPVPAAPAAASAPAPLSAARRAALLAGIKAQVNALYVFPEKHAAIVAALTRSEKAGRYDLASPLAFAEAVSGDLAQASGDRHMYLTFDPAQAEAAATRPADAEDAFWRARALRDNHGLGEMRILPGNVRYLKLTAFLWTGDRSAPAYDDAMRFLQEGDAMIIDLRGNGGGDAAAVNYLTSHFMKPDSLLMTFLRGSETPSQSRTQAYLPAGRQSGKPLYVLVDRGCFSACEEFAYHVQQFKLGELIGATTGGGANNNDLVPVGSGFLLSVSAGRPVHPVSGTNWEGVGIPPTVEAAPPQALDVALQRALTTLAASPSASADAKADYAWALPEAEAKLRPPTVPADRLQAMAGRYGEVAITLREGQLWYRRGDRPERRLVPLDDNGLFAIDGAPMVRVGINGDTLALTPRGAPPMVFRKS